MREDFYIHSDSCELKATVLINDSSDALVLNLHGGPGSGSEVLTVDYSFQILSRYYSMAYYDQRGSGLSVYDLRKGITKEIIIEDLHTVITELKTRYPEKHLFLWGGSFGSYLAMIYLEKYPYEVEKVIINSPLMYPSSPVSRQMLFTVMCGAVKNAFHGELRELFERECVDPDGMERFMARAEVREYMFRFTYPPRWMEGFWHWAAMQPWISTEDVRPLIAELRIPAQFVQGMEDPFCSAEENIAAIAAAANPLVTLVKLSPCGHGTFEDQPIEFCKSYINFFGHAEWSNEKL